MGCTLEERLALVLLDLIENFGVPDDNGGIRLTIPVRHYDLAELVGATRPRVSEHLRLFARKHLISIRNERLVLDPKGLKGYLIDAERDGFSEELS
jgi:CRP-like cAMP-binding protein